MAQNALNKEKMAVFQSEAPPVPLSGSPIIAETVSQTKTIDVIAIATVVKLIRSLKRSLLFKKTTPPDLFINIISYGMLTTSNISSKFI